MHGRVQLLLFKAQSLEKSVCTADVHLNLFLSLFLSLSPSFSLCYSMNIFVVYSIRTQPNELCYRTNHVNEFAATKQEKEKALDIECNTVFKQNWCISSFFSNKQSSQRNNCTSSAEGTIQWKVRLGVWQDRLRSSGCWCSAAYTTIYNTVVSTHSVFQHIFVRKRRRRWHCIVFQNFQSAVLTVFYEYFFLIFDFWFIFFVYLVLITCRLQGGGFEESGSC